MGSHHIVVTDEVYEKLQGLKTDRKALSYTILLRTLANEASGRDILLYQLSEAYTVLKKTVAGHIQDGIFVGIIERARIITINLIKTPKQERDAMIIKIEQKMDKLVKLSGQKIVNLEKHDESAR